MTHRRLLALSHFYELGVFVCVGVAVGDLVRHDEWSVFGAALAWVVGAFGWLRMRQLREEAR